MTQLLAHLFGDYILQSDWMAQNKTRAHWPAFVHALLYSLCFVPLCWHAPGPGGAWTVIFVSHFIIDRFRLARYVVWLKNLMGPWSRMETTGEAVERMKASGELPRPVIPPGYSFAIVKQRIMLVRPLRECPNGYPPTVPPWLSAILLIVADNTIHLAINYAALRWL